MLAGNLERLAAAGLRLVADAQPLELRVLDVGDAVLIRHTTCCHLPTDAVDELACSLRTGHPGYRLTSHVTLRRSWSSSVCVAELYGSDNRAKGVFQHDGVYNICTWVTQCRFGAQKVCSTC